MEFRKAYSFLKLNWKLIHFIFKKVTPSHKCFLGYIYVPSSSLDLHLVSIILIINFVGYLWMLNDIPYIQVQPLIYSGSEIGCQYASCRLDSNNVWYNDLLGHKWMLKFEFPRLKTVFAICHVVWGKFCIGDSEHPYTILNKYVWHKWYQAMLIWWLLYKSLPQTMCATLSLVWGNQI